MGIKELPLWLVKYRDVPPKITPKGRNMGLVLSVGGGGFAISLVNERRNSKKELIRNLISKLIFFCRGKCILSQRGGKKNNPWVSF